MAIVAKVFFANGDDVGQKVEIAPSKRAITKKYEEAGLEILKQINVTEQYTFTIEDVMKNKLTAQQKEFLAYVLMDAGITANNKEEEDGKNNNN